MALESNVVGELASEQYSEQDVDRGSKVSVGACVVIVRTIVVSTVTVVVVMVVNFVPSDKMLPNSEVKADQISPRAIERGERCCAAE